VERPFHPTVTSEEMRKLCGGYANVREAAGDAFDIGVACHGEFDTPSGIAISRAVEPLNVAFVEDSLHTRYHEGWAALRKATKVPRLTGEKLELLREFKPFLDSQAVEIVHPDISFAGGLTGCRKIADYAALTRTPVGLGAPVDGDPKLPPVRELARPPRPAARTDDEGRASGSEGRDPPGARQAGVGSRY